MPVPDGIYVDAEYHADKASIAIVVLVADTIRDVHAECIEAAGSQQAEEKAIITAKELFEGGTIFSDNSSAAAKLGATWIPRKINSVAHHAAKLAINNCEGDLKKLLGAVPEIAVNIPVFAFKKKKRKKKKHNNVRWKGRGIVLMGESRTAKMYAGVE